MKKVKFYVCPDCGNILFCTGRGEISCCGRRLIPLALQGEDCLHEICVEEIDGEFYVTIKHEMTKQHYITFAAYVTIDRVFLVKLYPEQAAAVRLPKMYGGQLYVCCNTHGLFKKALACGNG